jgi:hypothetical protein
MFVKMKTNNIPTPTINGKLFVERSHYNVRSKSYCLISGTLPADPSETSAIQELQTYSVEQVLHSTKKTFNGGR